MEQINRNIVAVLSSVIGYIYPSLAYILVALMFILIDNVSGYYCNRRVKNKYPDRVKSDRYSSYKAWRTIKTMGYAIIVILSFFIVETHITSKLTEFPLTAAGSMLICGVTGLSILENWATANDNAPKWLNILKKFLVDKTERYFDIDIDNDGRIGNNDDKEDK